MVLSIFLLTILSTASALFSRSHKFPLLSPRGEQVANEFQMILPENTKIQLSTQYSFNSIAPVLIDSGDVVTVQYSTSTTPNKYDWIGAYSPASVDVSTTVPVKYAWCDDDSNYLSTGKGSLTFNFTNLRADIKFYYFTNSTSYPVQVASAGAEQIIAFNNLNQPLRPRVVPSGDADVFKLLWSSASSSAPVLRWGVKSGEYTNTVAASTRSFSKSDLCGAPATTIGYRDLGLVHTAELVGMKALANQQVFYSFGDKATDDFSSEFVLHVPPLAGTQPPSRPTTVVLFDDLGRGATDQSYTWNEYGRPSINTSMAVGALVSAGKIDAIYHGGDISYATGYLAVWDFYLEMTVPMTSGVIYLTTVGNHESDWSNSASYYSNSDSGGECGVLATQLIPLPAPATTNEPWWSYDVGLIHFVGISTEHNYTRGSKQYDWLEHDLATVNRSVTPWVVFGGHRAMYINSNYGGVDTSDITVMDLMIEHLEPLLWKYKVNLGFYGHNHVVQRHSAVFQKQTVQRAEERKDSSGNSVYWHENPQATVHLIVGTGGAGFTINAVEPRPDWNENYFYQWGYSTVVAHNATHLSWEWTDSSDNIVYDRMVITQNPNEKSWHL